MGIPLKKIRYPVRVHPNEMENVMATNEYQVTGMTCGHCEMSVREEVGRGRRRRASIQVSAQAGTLVVTELRRRWTTRQVLAAVDGGGIFGGADGMNAGARLALYGARPGGGVRRGVRPRELRSSPDERRRRLARRGAEMDEPRTAATTPRDDDVGRIRHRRERTP
jgi:copper chaperone